MKTFSCVSVAWTFFPFYNTLWGSHTLYTETKTNNDQHLVPINLAQRTNSVFWWPPPLLASLWRLDRFWVAAGQCLYREVREAGNSREGKTRQGVTIKATPKTGVQTIWLILVLFKLHPVKKKNGMKTFSCVSVAWTFFPFSFPVC